MAVRTGHLYYSYMSVEQWKDSHLPKAIRPELSPLLWQTARSRERLDPNADTDDGLELRVRLYYGGADYKKKGKGDNSRCLAKPKLGETYKTRIKKLRI